MKCLIYTISLSLSLSVHVHSRPNMFTDVNNLLRSYGLFPYPSYYMVGQQLIGKAKSLQAELHCNECREARFMTYGCLFVHQGWKTDLFFLLYFISDSFQEKDI